MMLAGEAPVVTETSRDIGGGVVEGWRPRVRRC